MSLEESTEVIKTPLTLVDTIFQILVYHPTGCLKPNELKLSISIQTMAREVTWLLLSLAVIHAQLRCGQILDKSCYCKYLTQCGPLKFHNDPKMT